MFSAQDPVRYGNRTYRPGNNRSFTRLIIQTSYGTKESVFMWEITIMCSACVNKYIAISYLAQLVTRLT